MQKAAAVEEHRRVLEEARACGLDPIVLQDRACTTGTSTPTTGHSKPDLATYAEHRLRQGLR